MPKQSHVLILRFRIIATIFETVKLISIRLAVTVVILRIIPNTNRVPMIISAYGKICPYSEANVGGKI